MNLARFTALAALTLLGFSSASLPAQMLILQEGRTAAVAGKMRRTNDTIFVAVQSGGGSGEVGYPARLVTYADFPEPPQLSESAAFLTGGKPAEALSAIAPQLEYFQPIADIQGSWWPRLAIIQAEALETLGRAEEARRVLDQIVRFSKDPRISTLARLRLTAAAIAKGDHDKAIATCDEVLKVYRKDGTIAAEAWLRKGDALLARREFEPALLAYLHVSALHGRETALLPRAMLGSATAWQRLGNSPKAVETLTELTKEYPTSSETRSASRELARLSKTESDKTP